MHMQDSKRAISLGAQISNRDYIRSIIPKGLSTLKGLIS
jgi:hypothetical protein